MHTLALVSSRVRDFTGYLPLEGVALTFDLLDLQVIGNALVDANGLSKKGEPSVVPLHSPKVEFLGLDGLYELDIDAITIDATGRIVIRAEVRHGAGESVEVVVSYDELCAAIKD